MLSCLIDTAKVSSSMLSLLGFSICVTWPVHLSVLNICMLNWGICIKLEECRNKSRIPHLPETAPIAPASLSTGHQPFLQLAKQVYTTNNLAT